MTRTCARTGRGAQTRPVTAARRWTLLLRGWDEAGSVASELAVLTPLLILVLAFIVLVGRLTQVHLQVESAAHQAARAASQQATIAAAQQAADRVASGLGTRCDTPTATLDTSRWGPGGTVAVTLTCQAAVGDLTLLPIPAKIAITATFTSPIDRYSAGRS